MTLNTISAHNVKVKVCVRVFVQIFLGSTGKKTEENQERGEQITCDRLSDNRSMVMRMITRVKKTVMKGAMKPVIYELDRAGVKQRHQNYPFTLPPRKILRARNHLIRHEEHQRRQNYWVVPTPEHTFLFGPKKKLFIKKRMINEILPVPLSVDLVEVEALVDDLVLGPRGVKPREGYP